MNDVMNVDTHLEALLDRSLITSRRMNLLEILSRLVEAVEKQLGWSKLVVFSLAAEDSALQLVASSRAITALEDVPRELSMCYPRGYIAEHALLAEPVVIRTAEVAGSHPDAAYLRPLGERVLLLPLLGRRGIQCWSAMGCRQADCPAYETGDRPCWVVSGTTCRDGQPRDREVKIEWCLQCPVFGVVGLLLAGVSEGRDVREPDQRGDLSPLTAYMGAVIEAVQTSRSLIRLNVELEKRVATAIQDLARANQRIIHSEKLVATGKLAAGLAHEINNPLAVISTCVQSLLSGGDDQRAYRRSLDIVASEVQRMSTLVRGLLDLAREQPVEFVESDMVQLLENSIEHIVLEARGLNVNVRTAYELGEHRAVVDKAQLHQVFVNLLRNALQAMPEGGEIEVAVRAAPPDSTGDPMIDVVFADNGPGMAPEVLSRVFDPFFTTRSDSGGMGLGLAISQSVVGAHGGTILATSSAGEGSVFTVRLPLTPEATHAHRTPHDNS